MNDIAVRLIKPVTKNIELLKTIDCLEYALKGDVIIDVYGSIQLSRNEAISYIRDIFETHLPGKRPKFKRGGRSITPVDFGDGEVFLPTYHFQTHNGRQNTHFFFSEQLNDEELFMLSLVI